MFCGLWQAKQRPRRWKRARSFGEPKFRVDLKAPGQQKRAFRVRGVTDSKAIKITATQAEIGSRRESKLSKQQDIWLDLLDLVLLHLIIPLLRALDSKVGATRHTFQRACFAAPGKTYHWQYERSVGSGKARAHWTCSSMHVLGVLASRTHK